MAGFSLELMFLGVFKSSRGFFCVWVCVVS